MLLVYTFFVYMFIVYRFSHFVIVLFIRLLFTCLHVYLFTEVRQTITEYTMYIDGSSFYGSNEEDYPDLREFTGGENFAYTFLSFLNFRSTFT